MSSNQKDMKYQVKKHLVYKLKKALNGLKRVPQAWHSKLDKSLINLGVTRNSHEPVVFYRCIRR